MLEKVEDALGEHAHGYAVIALIEDETGEKRVSYKWDGGRITTLGLLDHLQTILRSQLAEDHKKDEADEVSE